MVVLSASVCTKQGKALVSRQFVEMNRLRIEGLLAAFPKLVLSTGQQQQHTFVETDTVRYIYQPLENQMYLLLITTKASNIVEDLGTLRLLAKVVPDVAGGFQEAMINDNAFDLIFAFDEVLTAVGGYKEEGATLSSIRTNLAMESHEEKMFLAVKQSKEDQARAEMHKRAKDIKERQFAQMKQNFANGNMTSLGGMEGFGGGGNMGGGGGGGGMFDQMQQQQQPQYQDPYAQFGAAAQPPPSEAPKVIAKGGMKLGGAAASAGKNNNLMAAMAAEDNLFTAPTAAAKGGLGGGAAAGFGGNVFGLQAAPVAKPAAAPSTPLSLALEEKISVHMTREGTVESCEVKGTLTLTANTDAGTMALVHVNKKQLPVEFNFATHPKVDKKMYETDGTLTLKGGKGFPLQRPVGILRWSYNNDDAAPITINCWPEDEGTGSINVNIEMELTRQDVVLHDVNILLPLGTTEAPVVENIDGEYKHDARSGMLCWHFNQVDAHTNASGSLEFSIAGHSTDAFFPVQIGFRSETLLCPLQVTGVANANTGASIPNQIVKSFTPETYQCV